LGESARSERIFDDDSAKNRRSLGKVRRARNNNTISGIENSFKKLSALFFFCKSFYISFIRLGAEKTSEKPTTRTQSALLFATPLSPLLLPLRKNISKKGVETFY
jgi:hypothetical protein